MRGLFPRLDEMPIPFSVRVMFEKLFVLFHINRIHCILLCARYCVKDLHVLSMYPDDNFINYMPSSYTLQLRKLILTWTNILNLLQFDFSQCLVTLKLLGFAFRKTCLLISVEAPANSCASLNPSFPVRKMGMMKLKTQGSCKD